MTIDVPLHLSYLPVSNLQASPRILAGPRYRYNIVNDEDFRAHQVSFDVGASVDFKIRNTTFRPTLLYTRGLSDLVKTTSSITSPIRMDTFTLKFLFFG